MANKIAIEIVVNDNGSVALKQFGDNAEKSLHGVSTAARGSDSAFTGMIGTLKNMLGLAAAAFGVHEIVSYGKEAVMLAARVETLGVVLGVVGENAGYSKGEMARYVEEVKKMGITTEVAHDAVIKIAQAQINVADSAKLARIAQDAAVIGNINSSDAFQRMINGIRSGEVEILKTIGLNVNFEQSYQRMARELGKSTESLSEQEKTQARANIVMDAGTRITGAYEASMGTAGKMSLSLARYTEELKLGLGQLFGVTFTDAVLGVTMLLKDMNAYMEEMKSNGAIAEMADMVATVLKMAWISVKDAIALVWNAVKPLGPIIAEVLPVLGMVAVGWGYILAAVKPVGTIIGEVISSVYNLGKMGGSVFGMLAAALTGQFELAGQYRDQFNAAYQSIADSGAKVVDAVTAGVEKSIMAHERELGAAVTTTKQKTAAQLAEEEKLSKQRAALHSAENAETAKRDAEAANRRSQAGKAIVEAIRKANIEANSIGKSQFEQDVARITAEAEKYRQAGVDKVLIAKYVAVEMEVAHKKAYEEMAKAARDAADAAISEMEREIAMGVALTEAHIKGAQEYRKLVAGEYEFAATENERAINKIIADATEKEIKLKKLLEKGYITAAEYEKAKASVNANKNAAILEKETQTAQKIADINYNLIKDIRGYETQAYQARLAQIDAMARAYIKDGADHTKVAAWKAEEEKKAYIQMAKYSDDWRDGVKAGLLEIESAHTTWGTVFYDTTKTAFDNAGKAFGSNFRDILKGDFSNISEVWKGVWDGMFTTFTDTLGKMLAEAAAKQIELLFKTSWVDTGAAVINFISTVLGFGNVGTGGTESYTGGGGGGGGTIEVDRYAMGGNHPGGWRIVGESGRELEYTGPSRIFNNDSTNKILSAISSQGRYGDTMLAHINTSEAALLQSMGGSGTVNPMTGLPEFFDFSSFVNIITGGVYGAVTGNWGGTKSWWSFLNPGVISALNAYNSSNIWDFIDAVFDPVTGPGLDNLLRASGKEINELVPWLGELIEIGRAHV